MTPQHAIELLLDKLEGREYSVDPVPTFAGITQGESRTAGVDDPRNLTEAQIDDIYVRKYWNIMNCGQLPDGLDFAVFQLGVNVGTVRAIRMLQAVLRVNVDGIDGPATVAAAKKANTAQVIADLLAAQDSYYDSITMSNPANKIYVKGWHNRVDTVRDLLSGVEGGSVVPGFLWALLGLVIIVTFMVHHGN